MKIGLNIQISYKYNGFNRIAQKKEIAHAPEIIINQVDNVILINLKKRHLPVQLINGKIN